MLVSDYIEIQHTLKAEFDHEADRVCTIVSIGYGLPYDEVEETEMKIVGKMYAELIDKIDFTKYKDYIGKSRKEITLGNLIDLEAYIFDIDNLHKICRILEPKYKVGKFDERIYIPIFDIELESKRFLSADVSELLNCLNFYHDFRNDLTNTYESIFEPNEPEEIDETDLTPGEIEQAKKDREQHQQKKSYAWEFFAYWLANNDVTKMEQVLNMGAIYALNLASMKKLFEE